MLPVTRATEQHARPNFAALGGKLGQNVHSRRRLKVSHSLPWIRPGRRRIFCTNSSCAASTVFLPSRLLPQTARGGTARSRPDYHCQSKAGPNIPCRLTYKAATVKLTTGRGHVKNFFRNVPGKNRPLGGGVGAVGIGTAMFAAALRDERRIWGTAGESGPVTGRSRRLPVGQEIALVCVESPGLREYPNRQFCRPPDL